MVRVTINIDIPEDWLAKEDWEEYYEGLPQSKKVREIEALLLDDLRSTLELIEIQNNIQRVEWVPQSK